MLDPFTESLLEQFRAIAAPMELPQIKELPRTPDEVRASLQPATEHQSEAI